MTGFAAVVFEFDLKVLDGFAFHRDLGHVAFPLEEAGDALLQFGMGQFDLRQEGAAGVAQARQHV